MVSDLRSEYYFYPLTMSAKVNIKYLIALISTLPFLPLLYLHGQKVRRAVPRLSEAEGCTGSSGEGNALNLLLIGESTFAGVGVSVHRDGFAGYLAKALSRSVGRRVNWTVVAKSGATAKSSAKKAKSLNLSEKADLVIVGLGGNDTFALTPPWQWIKQLRILLSRLRAEQADAPILFAGIPPVGEFPAFTNLMQRVFGYQAELLNEALATEIQSHQGVYYHEGVIVIADWLSKIPEFASVKDFFSDGVHPSPRAYQVWAEETARFIEKTGLLPSLYEEKRTEVS